MNMAHSSLSTYRKKRDFGITSEPRGEVAHAGKALAFVIQKHAATRLHYDFRLELDGTLKSWAVPKGPSLDPKVRRMAVHVEDHPISYGGFEGVIPKGQYGAGTVIVWDRGTWVALEDPREGYRRGKLKFELHGEKLHGRWTLVRMHGREGERQEPWLLIKENDEEARPASEYDIVEDWPDSVLTKPKANTKNTKSTKETKKAVKAKKARSGKREEAGVPAGAVKAKLPLAFAPQLAVLVDAPPAGSGCTYEVKVDGYRLLARIDGDDVRLFTRNGNDWTSRLEALRDEVASLRIASAWLDGEIVVLDANGNPSFQSLQNAFDARKTSDIVYFAFDAPHFGGYDLTRVPLAERRRVLQAALERNPSGFIRFSESFEGPVRRLLDSACDKGLEGLIGKKADAPYASRRSPTWIKLKCTKRQEFVVVGYTDPNGSRTGFGSLLLAVNEGGKLTYAGNVGTGFDQRGLQSLYAKLKALDTGKSALEAVPRGVKGHWVRPKLVAEVAFTEWTGDGRIRHPVFHGLRADKDPGAITREAAGTIKVTHGERVIDPASKATKLDLVEYYARVAPHMLPHLEGPAISIVRAPTGITGELFFQKHLPGQSATIEIATAEALVAAAQMNGIEFHTGNSTKRDSSHPDRVIFDLDPGEGIDWATLKEATTLTRKMLDLLGLESFLKTSGGKGLHVVVPLTPKWNYDAVKDFSELLVQHMSRTIPKLFVPKSGARNRVGRIFIDYLRNGKTATTIAAFSARARPGLGVSVPVAWRELSGLEAANPWNIANVFYRLKRQRADPWKDYAKTKQTLDAALRKLRQA